MKQLSVKLIHSIALMSFLAACAPDSRQMPSEATTTYAPKKPIITEGDSYRLARGATRIDAMDVVYDSETRSMSLKGRIEYLDLKDSRLRNIDLDMLGLADQNGFVVLKNTATMLALPDGVQVAAKATCLGQDLSCTASFIDIYLYAEGVVYHHQVEHDQNKSKEKVETPVDTEDDPDYGVGSDDVEGEPGPYVGSIQDDIRSLLDWNIIEDSKAEKKTEVKDPKKDDKKNEKKDSVGSDKKEDPKSPKKDEPKKEEPKKETPKKEEPKKEQPKIEAPKKEEPKKETLPPAKPPVKDEKKEGPKPADVAKANQAVGSVNSGRLENAANLLTIEKNLTIPGFKILRPERLAHFGANELSYIIQLMGKTTERLLPEYKLSVGDLSRERGGQLGRHKSHQNGLDVDVAFFFKNKTFQTFFASAVAVNKPHADWMVEPQWELFKEVVNTKLIDRIFIHAALKKSLCEHAIKTGELQKGKNDSLAFETLRRLIPEKDHHNHFHLRVKCSSAQVRCRQMAEPVANSGCF
ncbi:hypothetical protein BDW_03570 [Bdellovibrio bacteriovorus W]|nr:hypothetical protein BDW_03570 [Bdellovibrio bacteriovorus W]